MGGGYVSCGDFSGDDKSCSALKGVLEQIAELPTYHPSPELRQLVNRMAAFLSGGGDSEWTDYLLIPPPQALELERYLEECRRTLIADLGTADPYEGIEIDAKVPSLDPIDAKWGMGKGWRLYCITDLLLAIGHSRAQNEDICVAFD